MQLYGSIISHNQCKKLVSLKHGVMAHITFWKKLDSALAALSNLSHVIPV